ncbi:MAG: outer membrane lipoprotein-sorting protein [Calditrichaeota bacterium]|nr:outer membrane lipoprotein-sorting protein [Calditrichota bacterium]
MHTKNKILLAGLIVFLSMSFSLSQAQNISVDQLKQNIQKRLEQRNQRIKDYQCDMTSNRVTSTPRGDMEMESKFKIYFKSPDQRKVEFVEGKRGDRKITAQDMNRRGGRRGGNRRGFGNSQSQFDISKYLDNIKLAGTENIEGTDTYKLSIKVADKEDQFKSITVWIDQKTFDVVKYEAKFRPTDRLESGEIVRIFASVGPDGAWVPVKGSSERYMVFDTPMGEMDIESTGTTTFKNYKFNIGLKDDIFKTEK